MATLTKSLPLEMVLKSIASHAEDAVKVNLDDWSEQVETDLADIRVAAKGGIGAAALLRRGKIETPAEYDARREYFANVPVCGFGTAIISWLLFGEMPRSQYFKREQAIPDFLTQVMAAMEGKELDDFADSQTINQWFADTMTANDFEALAMLAAAYRVIDGVAWVKVFPRYDETTGLVASVGLAVMRKHECYPIWHPRDPALLVGLVEARSYKTTDGTKKHKWRLWSADRWDWISATGEVLEDVLDDKAHEHAFGRPPFAKLGGGESLLIDAVLDQKELNHRRSILLTITNSQGFSYLEVKGTPQTSQGQFQGPMGTFGTGPNRRFWFRQGGADAGIQFAMPNAPLAEHRNMLAELTKQSMRMSLKLPGDLVSDAAGPEQPTSIQWHWMISLIAYEALTTEGRCFMEDLSNILAPVGMLLGLPYSEGQLDWTHDFRKNPLPMDRAAERTQDSLDVDNGRMLLVEYVHKWTRPKDDPKRLAAYMLALAEQKKKNQAAFFPAMGNTPDLKKPGDGDDSGGDSASRNR